MDNHIVNVALPTLSRDFHASIASVQWTVIAYVLSLAIWIPASGWIGDRIGTKRTFLIALTLFTIASAACGQARNLPELIAARALQGTGGGMLTPSATAMLWRAYPPAQRARLARLLILPILVAPAVAPVLGGLLIEKLSWRWAFYVNLPFGVAAVIFSAHLPCRAPRECREPLRLFGDSCSQEVDWPRSSTRSVRVPSSAGRRCRYSSRPQSASPRSRHSCGSS